MCFCAWDEDSSVPDDDGMGGFGVAGDDEDDDDDDAMSDDDPKLYPILTSSMLPSEVGCSAEGLPPLPVCQDSVKCLLASAGESCKMPGLQIHTRPACHCVRTP